MSTPIYSKLEASFRMDFSEDVYSRGICSILNRINPVAAGLPASPV